MKDLSPIETMILKLLSKQPMSYDDLLIEAGLRKEVLFNTLQSLIIRSLVSCSGPENKYSVIRPKLETTGENIFLIVIMEGPSIGEQEFLPTIRPFHTEESALAYVERNLRSNINGRPEYQDAIESLMNHNPYEASTGETWALFNQEILAKA